MLYRISKHLSLITFVSLQKSKFLDKSIGDLLLEYYILDRDIKAFEDNKEISVNRLLVEYYNQKHLNNKYRLQLLENEINRRLDDKN